VDRGGCHAPHRTHPPLPQPLSHSAPAEPGDPAWCWAPTSPPRACHGRGRAHGRDRHGRRDRSRDRRGRPCLQSRGRSHPDLRHHDQPLLLYLVRLESVCACVRRKAAAAHTTQRSRPAQSVCFCCSAAHKGEAMMRVELHSCLLGPAED